MLLRPLLSKALFSPSVKWDGNACPDSVSLYRKECTGDVKYFEISGISSALEYETLIIIDQEMGSAGICECLNLL